MRVILVMRIRYLILFAFLSISSASCSSPSQDHEILSYFTSSELVGFQVSKQCELETHFPDISNDRIICLEQKNTRFNLIDEDTIFTDYLPDALRLEESLFSSNWEREGIELRLKAIWKSKGKTPDISKMGPVFSKDFPERNCSVFIEVLSLPLAQQMKVNTQFKMAKVRTSEGDFLMSFLDRSFHILILSDEIDC